MLHANNSSSPTPDPLSHTVPDSAGTVEHAQILSRLSTYGLSQLFIRDKQLMIEEMMSMNELQGIVIKAPAEAGEKDFGTRTFTELYDKLPYFCRVVFFQKLAGKFFRRELILWFWQLCSTDQQRLINNMFDDVNYCQVDVGDSAVDRLPDESEAFIRLGTFTELLATFPWHWEGFSRLWELSGDDQSRYAEFFLGLSTFCIRTQCSDDAEDQVALALEKFGCDVIQKLPYESEEDFRVRRFKASFTKLQFSSQLCIVSQLLEELKKTEEEDKKEAGNRDFCSRNNIICCKCFGEDAEEWSTPKQNDEEEWEWIPAENYRRDSFLAKGRREELCLPQFIKVKCPDLRGGGGSTTTTTQGGGSRGLVRNHRHALRNKFPLSAAVPVTHQGEMSRSKGRRRINYNNYTRRRQQGTSSQPQACTKKQVSFISGCPSDSPF